MPGLNLIEEKLSRSFSLLKYCPMSSIGLLEYIL
jgi:hypothetical protein